jgi:hypothetical protein
MVGNRASIRRPNGTKVEVRELKKGEVLASDPSRGQEMSYTGEDAVKRAVEQANRWLEEDK